MKIKEHKILSQSRTGMVLAKPFLIQLLLVLCLAAAAGKGGKWQPLRFSQLKDSMALHPRPVIVSLTASWCSYCHLQAAQFRSNDSLRTLLQRRFYWVQLDAEDKTNIEWNGTVYRYAAGEEVHGLATALVGNNREISYPGTIVLNKNYQPVFVHGGLIKANELLKIVNEITP
jgi:thioredoxin-related protein